MNADCTEALEMFGYILYVYILLWDDIDDFIQNVGISDTYYSLCQS